MLTFWSLGPHWWSGQHVGQSLHKAWQQYFHLQCGLHVLCLLIRLGEYCSVPSLLPGASQSDPGFHLYLGTRKTHLVPGYVHLSNNHRLPLLGTRLRTPLWKTGRERGFWVLLLEGKASTSSPAMAPQNKANLSLVASSTKNSSSKLSLSSTPKKQPNTLQVDLSSKLASNGKLTSNECKKCLENNLCLYCGVGDHKLDSCPKKQTTVSSKIYGALATASEKPSEK